jgi:aryl-phospho-beta-D-glucosidase BglC (GH1 family)
MLFRFSPLLLVPLALLPACGDDSEACSGAACGTSSGGTSGGSGPASGGAGGTSGSAGSSATGGAAGTGGAPAAGTGGGGTGGTTGGTAGSGAIFDPSAPAGSPVSRHGKLSVDGKHLKDEGGNIVQLKGISSMWLHWEEDGYAESKSALEWLRDNWKIDIVRAAMGVEPEGAYLDDPGKAKAQLENVVRNAIELGLYVIIDWHDHEALSHQAQAESFFDEMAGKYGEKPNVLYETFNEPLMVDWATQLKPYHEAVIAKIRAKDPDNLIILGTPQWSQNVDAAANSPLTGTNLLYTLHFYACTHTDWLRQKAAEAVGKNLPLFVTEWGATHADGGLDGIVCEAEAQAWHTFLNQHQISWTAWKFDGCKDSSCLLREGAPVNGGFDDWLQGHGPFVRARLLE